MIYAKGHHPILDHQIPKSKTMKNIMKSPDSCSPINQLPDEILLQIITKIPNLKTLCFLYLISKRFSSLVLQIPTISFTPKLINPDVIHPPPNNGIVFKLLNLLRGIVIPPIKPFPPIISSFYGVSFRSAVTFLTKFRCVKSLFVELPSSNHNSNCLFNWKVKFGNRVDTFLFISPNSINEQVSQVQEIELSNESLKQKVHIAFQCLKDVIIRHRMLLYFVKEFPMLENISITDTGRRGRLVLSGRKLVEVRDWMELGSDSVKPELKRIEVPVSVGQCYVPVLELPVSGCVMKGVTFVVMEMNSLQSGSGNGNGNLMNDEDGFEEKEEVAYSEAVMEIMENHKDKMKRLL